MLMYKYKITACDEKMCAMISLGGEGQGEGERNTIFGSGARGKQEPV
jgi:hypothetical protein